MGALYCPTCDYNLTGLAENRCPECGNPFEPERLRRTKYGMPEPPPRPVPSLPRAIVQLVWPAVVMLICPLPPLLLPDEGLAYVAALILGCIGVPLVFSYGLLNSFELARYLYLGSEQAAKRDEEREGRMMPLRLLGYGLYLAQLWLSLAPCSYLTREYLLGL